MKKLLVLFVTALLAIDISAQELKWVDIITNGDLSGNDVSSFLTRENGGDPSPSIIENEDGFRCIKVTSAAGAMYDWDTAFWIVFSEPIAAGSKLKVSFECKANKDYINIDTQAHRTPRSFICNDFIDGGVWFSTDWYIYEYTITVSSEMDGVQSIAFNLSKDKENEVTFYFCNFVVQKGIVLNEGNSEIVEEEWNLLRTAYMSLEKTDEWNNKWDFSSGTHTVASLPGVKAKDGHIVSIDLSYNNITGVFPFALLTLPYLESLNISGNNLTGDIGTSAVLFALQNPSVITNIKELNISNNKFSGNIGLFAKIFAQLETLDASHNCLEDVYPMISPNVTSLNLSHQIIGRVVELHLSNMTVEEMATKVPSILIYNHQNQTFVPNINVLCTTEDKSWGMAMSYQNRQMAATYVSGQNTYYGNSGDTFNVSVLKNDGTPEGSTFRIKLYFDEGDSNFDGQVNVLDLQTDINYIMEKYQKRPYNFTAANLWKDDLINIQDIICLVNLLINTENVGDEQSASARRRAMQMSDATVYVQNGQLMLNTTLPVAAFDITLSGADGINVTKDMERTGMTITKKVTHDGIRLIGYSMNGAYIPMGDTAIGTLSSNAACVRHAMLSDSEANNISVSVDANTTGIETVRMSSSESTEIYDLQGRKVNTMSHKGLYIMNGRKIIK